MKLTAVASPTSITIDNDLSAGNTSIGSGSADGEHVAGVDDVLGLWSDVLLRNNLLDKLGHHLGFDLLGVDAWGVLDAHQDSVDSQRSQSTVDLLIFHSHLRLGIRSGPREGAVESEVIQLLEELGSQNVGQRHQFFGLIGSVSHHEALVAGTDLIDRLLDVDSIADLARLRVDRDDYLAGLRVESDIPAGVAEFLGSLSDNLLVVDFSLACDLAQNHDHVAFGGSFTSNSRVWILLKTGVEDRIRDVVTELIWMAARYTFASEQVPHHKIIIAPPCATI